MDHATGEALGVGSIRIRADPANGVIEIGHIWMSPTMQRTRLSTETIFLMMRHAFDDLGVRRVRVGMQSIMPRRGRRPCASASVRGRFPAAFHRQGRAADTAWFAFIDSEWPKVCARPSSAGWPRGNFDDGPAEDKVAGHLTLANTPPELKLGNPRFMSVDQATVERVARLARIKVKDEDVPRLRGRVERHSRPSVEQLNEVDVSGVDP